MSAFGQRLFRRLLPSRSVSRRQSSSNSVKTALYDFHVEQGGKLVDFAGFQLPVLYSGLSITASHLHTRRNASLFDVSHMLQVKVHGVDRAELLERITTADVRGLPPQKATLSVFTHPETGGILDDLIITNTNEGYIFVVSNAGRRDHDSRLLHQIEEEMRGEKKDVRVECLEINEISLLALQGPQAVAALQPICKLSLEKMPFMSSMETTIGGIEKCRISRCGYTGEDGFEISVSNSQVHNLAHQLINSASAKVSLAGLGARDSLRLEAGLCLYGSDIGETTTPVEAGLAWLLHKERRARQDFPGAAIICRQLKEGVSRKRVGLKLESGPPARHDCEVFDESENKLGAVTSGGPSPSLGFSIAMAYLNKSHCKRGTKVLVNVRGKKHSATVVSMPFLPTNYFAP